MSTARFTDATITVVAAWICLLCTFNFAQSFPPSLSGCAVTRCEGTLCHHNDRGDDEQRRLLLKKAAVIGLVTVAREKPATAVPLDFDCLLDLPPVTPGCARVYLCRHGQTENNRLHLVQGARVDPPINQNGREQAQRLGMAVSRLTKSSAAAAAIPNLVVHSKLRRARETAELLASTASSQATLKDRSTLKVFGELPSLGEVDFGNLEGKDVNDFRKEMRTTVANWSIGNIDARTGGGGESGRQVLERAVLALEKLGNMATLPSATSSAIIAVSHSAYLRILLSLANGSPLVESTVWKIQNGSVNVVDVNVEGKRKRLTSNSGLFGGKLVGTLRGQNGLNLEMPEAHLIRKNEVRHLQGMNV